MKGVSDILTEQTALIVSGAVNVASNSSWLMAKLLSIYPKSTNIASWKLPHPFLFQRIEDDDPGAATVTWPLDSFCTFFRRLASNIPSGPPGVLSKSSRNGYISPSWAPGAPPPMKLPSRFVAGSYSETLGMIWAITPPWRTCDS